MADYTKLCTKLRTDSAVGCAVRSLAADTIEELNTRLYNLNNALYVANKLVDMYKSESNRLGAQLDAAVADLKNICDDTGDGCGICKHFPCVQKYGHCIGWQWCREEHKE